MKSGSDPTEHDSSDAELLKNPPGFLAAKNIPVNDLNNHIFGRAEIHRDGVYFNQDGVVIHAAQVTAHFEKFLNG